ncbi:MAG: Preprotein translocase subunit SecG [Myxococcaceae bacterium]|jgi:preprotein translocase subunit SecG|nr:Preprotein translocase subunit SecG [Myxococcaceae bacterium]MEA2752382.1 preprotein translocase subunit SecG [Myxococcales bacterium]
MLSTFVNIVHIFVCCVLMFVVLLQQGKGGGMGSAFGGASAQVFGGSGAGNILTRATAICAAIFMLTSVTLAYMSSSGDRALRAKVAEEQSKVKDRGEKRAKTDATPTPSGSAAPAPSGGPLMNAPSPSPKDSAPTPAP